MFMTGMDPFLGSVFTFTTLLIAIPSANKEKIISIYNKFYSFVNDITESIHNVIVDIYIFVNINVYTFIYFLYKALQVIYV